MSKTPLLVSIAAIAIAAVFAIRLYDNPQSSLLNQRKESSSIGAKWHKFNGSPFFTVSLPTLPQHATEKLKDPKTKTPRQYEMYLSEKENGTIFMISIIKLLEDSNATIDNTVLSNVINDILNSTPNGILKQMKMGKYKQYPAIDFSIENDQVQIDGKVFLVDKTLYALTTAAKLGLYDPEETNYFFNSFELLEPSTKMEKK